MSIRVAMIGHKDFGESGGVERHVLRLGQELVRKGIEVHAFSRARGSQPRVSTVQGITVHRSWGLNTRSLDALTNSLSAAWRSRTGFDLVHVHALGPSLVTPLLYHYRIPTVVTIHGLDWQRAKWGLIARMVLRAGQEVAVRFSTRIIVVSKSLQDYFTEKYGLQTVYIPNGVDPPVLRPPNQILRLGIKPRKYLLFMARLVPEKGCHYLVQASREFPSDVQVIVAGGSSHTDDYVKRLHSMSEGRVLFVGEVTGELKEELYTNALAYVLPSDLEGMPIGLLEAMSYGIPVIVSDIQPNKEIVNGPDVGVTFQAGNVSDLVKKVNDLVSSPDHVLRQLGTRGREAVLKRYSWREIADKTLDVYSQALGGTQLGLVTSSNL